MRLKNSKIKDIVVKALREDRSFSDVTTSLLIPKNSKANAQIIVREDCIVCGLELARSSFKLIDPKLKFSSKFKDGQAIKKGSVIARISGKARAILSGERVALNFLSHSSGIATLTAKFLKVVKAKRVKILDTRKTIPLLRGLQKYAVRCGGGINHRISLKDFVLIKDNHKQLLLSSKMGRKKAASDLNLKNLISKAREQTPARTKIEIEVENVAEFYSVIRGFPDIVMLDNMNLKQIKNCVNLRDRFSPQTKLEASGNISLKNIKNIARSGVDFISIGALTHSPKAIDFSLEVINSRRI